MAHEIEAAAGGAFSSLWRRAGSAGHGPAAGTPCANCATPLMGPWCHACGQMGEDFHRSIWKLIGEGLEGLLHIDGRVWSTLHNLMLRPSQLTRAYLDGHRAPQIPPFRLFLVMLVVVFLAGTVGQGSIFQSTSTVTGTHGKVTTVSVKSLEDVNPAQRAKLAASIQKGRINLPWGQFGGNWLKDRMVKVMDDPRLYYLLLESWGERFAFLTLPMAVGLVSLVFIFQRRWFIFDHAIFSLHSLSAVGVLVAVSELLSPLIGGASGLILWAAPVHLFVHMRGVYRTSVLGALTRMAILFVGSAVIGVLIFLGLLLVGLNGMGQ